MSGRSITVDGEAYRVVEDVSVPGLRMVVVDTPDGEKTAVMGGKRWRWWTAKDRVR